jgi:hypothetical protein
MGTKNTTHITLYSNEYSEYIWGEYCNVIGIDPLSEEVKIVFDKDLVTAI